VTKSENKRVEGKVMQLVDRNFGTDERDTAVVDNPFPRASFTKCFQCKHIKTHHKT
jgi:hypothetical protein